MNSLRGLSLILSLAASLCAGPAAARQAETGPQLLARAFDPGRNFAGELLPNSNDEIVLTAFGSARDDYAPSYSLAIAYRCGAERCGYVARMLRVKPAEGGHGQSLRLGMAAHRLRTTDDLAVLLDEADLDWLEADVDACPQGVFAMDSVRVADWNPGIHYALQPVEEREIILHPAQIRIRMSGSYSTSRYEGWVMAPGAPAAVRTLLDTLEPCWRPATSTKPWER